jgi:hypothetical protein
MTSVVDAVKEQWHRDIASHPVVHGWVLNLYRAGERYPQTVTDYFPAERAECPVLAARLREHGHDERRHTAIYEHAIRALDQPVDDLEGDDVFNNVIRGQTVSCFTITEGDDRETVRLKLAHFLTHAHHLEKRVERSLLYHRDACEHVGAGAAERAVAAVLLDETRHVRYTAEAAREMLTRAEAVRVFAEHRRAEARANLLFSERQVRIFARRYRRLVGGPKASFYRVCAVVMEGAAALV